MVLSARRRSRWSRPAARPPWRPRGRYSRRRARHTRSSSGAGGLADRRRERCAVLHVCRGDVRGQEQSAGIDSDMPLDPVDLLRPVITARSTDGRAVHRGGVDHRPGRLRPLHTATSCFLPKRAKDLPPYAGSAPPQEVLVRRGPADGEVVRQRPPRTAGADHVQDRVQVLPPPLGRAWTPAARVFGDYQPGEPCPGRVGQIRRVGAA